MRKAQSTLEYAIVIVVMVAALISMQIYLKRAVQGRIRQTADDLGLQYDPNATTGTIEITSDSLIQINTTTEEVDNKSVTTSKTNIIYQTDGRSGSENIGAQ